jgi:hypothetical protein
LGHGSENRVQVLILTFGTIAWSQSMRSILIATVVVLVVPSLRASEKVENPFKKTKVGDWVEYKMTSPTIEGKTKMTVVAKDDKELTYEVSSTLSFMGKETQAPVQKIKVDLTKNYDPDVIANLKSKDTKIEKVGEGKEKVKVGDKEFDTKWTKLKTSTTVNRITINGEYKMWYSKDVPMSGMVKMETTTSNVTTTVELIGWGSK